MTRNLSLNVSPRDDILVHIMCCVINIFIMVTGAFWPHICTADIGIPDYIKYFKIKSMVMERDKKYQNEMFQHSSSTKQLCVFTQLHIPTCLSWGNFHQKSLFEIGQTIEKREKSHQREYVSCISLALLWSDWPNALCSDYLLQNF